MIWEFLPYYFTTKNYSCFVFSFDQAKDKVIASLRDGSSGEVTSGISSSEYEEVCHERDMFKDEVNQVRYKMEQLKADVQVIMVINFSTHCHDLVDSNEYLFTDINFNEFTCIGLRTTTAIRSRTGSRES